MLSGVVGDIAHINSIVLIHSSFKVVPLKMSMCDGKVGRA